MNEKCTKLTLEQSEFALKMIVKWMNVCEDNNRGCSSADVDHSSLLHRLLMGGTLHENPPPLRRSYPAWSLVEQDEIEIQEMYVCEIDGRIVIDQHGGYKWVDKEKNILKHTRLGINYEYSEREVTPDVRNLRRGLIPEDHKYIGKFLKRLNDPATGKEEIWKA